MFPAPIVSPMNTRVTRTTSSAISVSWTKLKLYEARGFISNYTVEYFPVYLSRKRLMSCLMSVSVGSDADSVTIDGLEEEFTYEVQVFASTEAGEGKKSASISVPHIIGNIIPKS